MKDYYHTLEVEKGASQEEIKKSFRKLAAKYHPDKKGGDEGKFKEISEAYAVLGDQKKRAEYDTYGRSYSTAGSGGAGGPQWGGFQGGVEFDIGDLGNIFEGFGEFFGGSARARAGRARGRDISIDIELQLAEGVFGATRRVLLTKTNACPSCLGTGAEKAAGTETCTACNGNGKIRETRQSILGSFTTVRECAACAGRGAVPKVKCPECAGRGVVRGQEEIEITVPPGIEAGEMIRLTGRGEAARGGTPGDLYVKVHVGTHPSIVRDGEHLRATLPVKLTDALLGASYEVETLDGTVTLKIPAGIRSGETLRIRGRGVPSQRGRGDFLATVVIDTPQKLTRKARKLVEELQAEGI